MLWIRLSQSVVARFVHLPPAFRNGSGTEKTDSTLGKPVRLAWIKGESVLRWKELSYPGARALIDSD